ncbi:MAG: hypothetical protein PHR56_02330 [Dehalococcoidales bacterium]|nr:hypothetical protein [Dehalococcoidales bacterium]
MLERTMMQDLWGVVKISRSNRVKNSLLEIVWKRYAQGEISIEQYHQIKKYMSR